MSEQSSTLDLNEKERAFIDQLYQAIDRGSLYFLLGVPEDADTDQIRRSYYEMSRHWHPDRFFRRNVGEYGPRIEAIFVAVTQAYQTLSSPTRRAAYDRENLKKRSARPAPAAATPSVSVSPPAAAPAPAPQEDDLLEADAEEEDLEDDEDDPTESSIPASASPPAADAAAPPAPESRRRPASRYRDKVVSKVRQDVLESVRRARRYYEAGRRDLEESNPIKAESALYLAVKLDPRNKIYRQYFEQAQAQARQIRGRQFVTAAEAAEGYQNIQEALYNYRKAVEYGVDDAQVLFRLGRLIRRFEKDDREALRYLREAVLKDPEDPEYRLTIAELYGELGLSLNARREYQEAARLATDKETRARAREGLRLLR